MKCRHCAANNIDNAVFCKHCGVAIDHTQIPLDSLSSSAQQSTAQPDSAEEKAAKDVRLNSSLTDHLLNAVVVDTTDQSSYSAKFRHVLSGTRFKLWSLMGASFIVFPLVVAGFTSFVLPWMMRQFYSNDLKIQETVKQQAVNGEGTALSEQQLGVERMSQQSSNLTTTLAGYYQLLLFYQEQSEQFYQQNGRFPKHLNELQQYPVIKPDMPPDEKVTILDRGVIMATSDQLPQLKLYAVPQIQQNQRIKWQCYSSSLILSNFANCILLKPNETMK